MAEFVEIHNDWINVEDISRVEFVSDDIYLGLFPEDEEGNMIMDFVPFTYAKVHTFSGQIHELVLDLYSPEEGEPTGSWANRNRAYIHESMTTLNGAIGKIIKVTGVEYQG